MKKQGSRILSLVLALCLSAALAVPAFAARTFTDIDEGHWAWDAVQTCAEAGVVNGFTDGSFRPEDPVTSVELVVMLTRTFYGGSVQEITDTAGKPWYYPYITVGDNAGVTQGLTVGETPMTRCDMAKVLYNTMMMRLALKDDAAAPSEEAIINAPNAIKDWDQIPQDRQTAVKYCYAYGIITGKDGGKFCGEDGMTRAEACMVMTRMMDLLTDTPPAEPETPAAPETPTVPETPTEPEAPAESEQPKGPALPNGMEINDGNIREIIYGLKADYPEGMRWTNDNSYFSKALRTTGYGCAGFALICSDAVFGDMPATGEHSDFDQIRVGDILRVMYDTHSVIVLEKKADSVVVAEGNYNYSIHWGREISRAELEKENFVATTRYPA